MMVPAYEERDWPRDASDLLGEKAVDFHLSYKGKLPSTSDRKTRTEAKHEIRECLSHQLETLWREEPTLNPDNLREADWKSSRITIRPIAWVIDLDAALRESMARPYLEFFGAKFVPLVIRLQELVCDLDITFLRREDPGQVIQGGDLDNRLKTLFDALRMPHTPDEIPPDAQSSLRGQTIFCLLEDDSLISKFCVTTKKMLTPIQENEYQNDVALEISVVIKALSHSNWMASS